MAGMSSEAEAPIGANGAGSVWRETLDIGGRVAGNPYGMVAGALGVGFVLGGGLFTRLTARLLGAGLRIGLMAALPVLREELVRHVTASKLDVDV